MNLHILIQIIFSFFLLVSASADAQSLAKPNCPSMCGNFSIPYPFGIGEGCYHDEWYALTCRNTSNPTKAYLSKYNMEVLEVDLTQRTITVMNPVASNCRRQKGNNTIWSSTDFIDSPYAFSTLYNKFVVVGCDTAFSYYNDFHELIRVGCLSSRCTQNVSRDNHLFICESPFTSSSERGMTSYTISIEESTKEGCTQAFLVDFRNDTLYLYYDWVTEQLPVVVGWVVKYPSSNKYCSEGATYDCQCPLAHTGNPYITGGCKIIEACANCKGDCHRGQGTNDFHCGKTTEIILGSSFALGLSFLLLCGSCFMLYRLIKKKRMTNIKKKFFKRNGGLLLEQQISSDEGTVKKTIIFTSDDLLKATDNYNENRILGQGGQGTVYKGMLTDGKITAIKKSNVIDESQLEQFINEVVILSQINHRNIVKLLGCCLETEVPLLVYEFVLNGNLFDLIHNENEEMPLSWKMRLQIATEVAGAVAYLHSSSSVPIYHRDIKSTNILLDEKFRAKIADFGTSRSIAIEQTHLTTLVYGTFGYLDPEYFRSSQFTDKSDVYSFGVVLAELITGQKPISSLIESEEERGLAARFISCVEQMRVFDITDARILEEAPKEEILAISDIARRCLNLNGKKRPTMKEVMMDLEVICRAPSTLEHETFNIENNTNRLDHDDYSTSTMIKSDYRAFSSSDVKPLVFYTQ